MIQDGRTFSKIVLANGGVIETADGTDIVVVSANGTVTLTGTETVIASEVALAEGNLLLGNASGVGSALNAKTSGQIVVGNGTTAVSVAMSGDATLASSGALTTTKIAGAPKRTQATPTAKTTSATLTAAEVLVGLITVNQGGGASSAQQLPTVSDLEAALTGEANDDAFDFHVINISTVDAEDASITTNTGWTLVGKMDVLANNAAGTANTSGHFRARKTGTGTWTLYRVA